MGQLQITFGFVGNGGREKTVFTGRKICRIAVAVIGGLFQGDLGDLGVVHLGCSFRYEDKF